jgi:hypothetical protein
LQRDMLNRFPIVPPRHALCLARKGTADANDWARGLMRGVRLLLLESN